MDTNFYPYLYAKSNVPEMLHAYCLNLLSTSTDPITREKAKRLLGYRKLLMDRDFFNRRIQDVFFDLYQTINAKFPLLTYELSGRIKGLVSTLNKVEETEENVLKDLKREFLQSKGLSAQELGEETICEEDPEFKEFVANYKFDENPFNRIRDFFAFRIIIEDEGKGDLIDELYQVTNLMIEFFNSKTFEVVKSHSLNQTGPLKAKADILYVPEKSGIKEEYKHLVKDYVAHPKEYGYQSVHFVVYDPVNERFFEVQTRTRSMNIISETLANHDSYKEKRYGERLQKVGEELDMSKIHVKGFRYFKYTDPITHEEKEYISDKAGITEAISIKLEFEHFLV